jgi:8-oxo-dGTP pyrophosphatase MutT (NUDIX family)
VDRRLHLARLLEAHVPQDPVEARYVQRMEALLRGSIEPFSRDHFQPGHFTASAFVLDPGGLELLLIHHGKLQRWLQPGGHVDLLDDTVETTARREVLEECGLDGLIRVGEGLFDVDVHAIPAHGADPAHEHFDLRFLFRARHREVRPGSDAHDARWVALDAVENLESDTSVLRAVAKLKEAD